MFAPELAPIHAKTVMSEQTLMRLFAYLGATPAALEEAANDLRR
jgi:hypothetical protein